MKRHELLRQVAKAAGEAGVRWELVRQGAGHEIWRCGSVTVAVPRHAEIGNQLARAIFTDIEAELGENWWRR